MDGWMDGWIRDDKEARLMLYIYNKQIDKQQQNTRAMLLVYNKTRYLTPINPCLSLQRTYFLCRPEYRRTKCAQLASPLDYRTS